MEINEIFYIEKYEQAYDYIIDKNLRIVEIEPDDVGRRFIIQETPKPTEQEILKNLRNQREIECFSIINRGQLWYNTLTEEQKQELDAWYKAWLDVTETKNIPEKPSWLK